jgi:glycosyltransferase involved in cell wall biosynthesis
MKVLHVVPSYAIIWGGPPKIVYQVIESLKDKFDIDILTTYTPGEIQVNIPEGVNFFSYKRSWFHSFWRSHSMEFKQFLELNIPKYDMVHIHEIWLFHFFITAKIASKHRIPFVVTPHGELDEWALSYKGFKKKIFSFLFQKKLLKRAAAIHVGTAKESEEVRRYLKRNVPPIFEIPNALLNDKYRLEPDSKSLDFDYNQPYILFLSRINIKKGCDLLIKAYAKWKGKGRFKLVLAGPPEPASYEKQLQQLVHKLGIADRVIFVGSVQGEIKKRLLKNAALYALTSYAEGFPVAILEALEAGCVLLLSNKCGVDEFLKTHGAAIVCETNVQSVHDGLDHFINLSINEIKQFKDKGPALIEKYFSSDIVAKKYISMYQGLHSLKE